MFTVINSNVCHCGQANEKSLEVLGRIMRKIDIIALQEAHTHCFDRDKHFGEELAEYLGVTLINGINGTSILSKHPMKKARNNGVYVTIGDEKVLYKNIHLTDVPYQPFQIDGVSYGHYRKLYNAEQAEESSRLARKKELSWYLVDTDETHVVLSGDFNEPSHLDWTERAAEQKMVKFAVPWYCSTRLAELGFIDTYRSTHTNEVKYPGYSWGIQGYDPWSQRAADGKIRKDRIDFIYAKGLEIIECSLIGPRYADWISDHASVVAKLEFP